MTQQHLVYLKERRGKIALACGSASIILTRRMLRRLADEIDLELGRERCGFWVTPLCEAELLLGGWPGPPDDDGSDPW